MNGNDSSRPADPSARWVYTAFVVLAFVAVKLVVGIVFGD